MTKMQISTYEIRFRIYIISMAELYKALTNVSLLIYLKDKYMSLGLPKPRNHLEVKLAYSKQISTQVGHSGNLSLCHWSLQSIWNSPAH